MNFNNIFNNVPDKKIITYYSVECNGENTVFSSTDYIEAAEIFQRVIKELKKNDIEDVNVNTVSISKKTMNRCGHSMILIAFAERTNKWNIELPHEEFFD